MNSSSELDPAPIQRKISNAGEGSPSSPQKSPRDSPLNKIPKSAVTSKQRQSARVRSSTIGGAPTLDIPELSVDEPVSPTHDNSSPSQEATPDDTPLSPAMEKPPLPPTPRREWPPRSASPE